MTWSLWRGGEHLGDIVVRIPKEPPDGLYGLLRPTAAFTDIGHLTQTTAPDFMGGAVFITRFTGMPNPGPVNLRQLSPEEALGLPPDQQLQLRNRDGQPMPIDTISIHPTKVPLGSGPFPDLCREHEFVDTAWEIGAFRNEVKGPDPR
ncbi:MAG: hypothetical protein H7066_01605 [Cytophagaceae bacterium]|nr:hypothetical protein [Gemmatimonadaceae bacterium]